MVDREGPLDQLTTYFCLVRNSINKILIFFYQLSSLQFLRFVLFLLVILLVAFPLSNLAASFLSLLPEDLPSLKEESLLVDSRPATELHRDLLLDL